MIVAFRPDTVFFYSLPQKASPTCRWWGARYESRAGCEGNASRQARKLPDTAWEHRHADRYRHSPLRQQRGEHTISENEMNRYGGKDQSLQGSSNENRDAR
jgi:hypothetical protein